MSQVVKSASALARAFFAMLDLDAMAIPLISPLKLAGVHGDGSAVGLSIQRARVSRLAPALARGDLPFPMVRKAAGSLRGSASKARDVRMNSTTSNRRSPPSYLATKDCGFFTRRASACWVRPAAFRAPIMSSQNAAWSEEWMDLPIPRGADVISRVS